MVAARNQAEGYARNLEAAEPPPPFLVVSDVGNVVDLYADFSGSGRLYAPFPDAARNRVALGDLRDPETRATLAAVFTDPLSLDPARRQARVTVALADRLAVLATSLDGAVDVDGAPMDAEAVAGFLSRCLFAMFARGRAPDPRRHVPAALGGLRRRPGPPAPRALGLLPQDGRRRLRRRGARERPPVQRALVQGRPGAAADGREPGGAGRGGAVGLVGGRAVDLRDAPGAGARPPGAPRAGRPLYAPRLRRAAGRPGGAGAAPRGVGRRAGGGLPAGGAGRDGGLGRDPDPAAQRGAGGAGGVPDAAGVGPRARPGVRLGQLPLRHARRGSRRWRTRPGGRPSGSSARRWGRGSG